VASSANRKVSLSAVVLPTLPAIVGTGVFLADVIRSKLSKISAAPPVDFSWQPTFVQRVRIDVLITIYFACYFGATFGPLLLPLAGYQAFRLTRAVGLRSRVALWAWTFVVLGVVATALFWGWLSKLDIYI
jgi:hypothetical protein